MIHGHGDDIYLYDDIRLNFSSNVYNHFDHAGLYAHLARRMALVESYPDPAAAHLEAQLAAHHALAPSQVMATAGATEAIYLVAQAFAGAHTTICVPTFAEYADACRLFGHEVSYSTLVYARNMPDIQHARSDTLWLCCPNNPTGTVVPRAQLLHAIDALPQTVFVIDASYAPFTRETLVTPVEAAARTNVIMLHSMTKRFSVPGLRLGYVTANAALVSRLRAQQRPWSIDSLAQEAAAYLLAHAADYVLPLDILLAERQRLTATLTAMGIEVHDSDSHILLCRLAHGTAADLKENLARHHGILIRDAANFHGLTPAHFRIAAQTPPENDALIAALRECLPQ